MGHLFTRRSFIAVLMLSGLAFVQPTPAQNGRSVKTYIALGDSIAFGYSNGPVLPSNGDRGYVGLYADYLASEFDGKRPTVINLAVYGETTTSFFEGVDPSWPYREATANTNYASEAETQAAKFLATVASAEAARNQVKVVSFALGANDAFALVTNPAFFFATPEEQFVLLEQMFAEIEANYIAALDMIREELPHAKLLLPNYYNAFDNPFADPAAYAIFEYVALRHDAIVRGLAADYKGKVVDIYSVFQGHALEYTNIALGNIHPTSLGYEVIAQTMIDASND
jgi:lysophospholipase L1-like esterase